MTDEEKIKAYNAARNAMLLRGDPQELIDFQIAHGLEPASSLAVAEIMVHKCRTAVLDLPPEVRKASWQWLMERGYSTFDDGDFSSHA
jgi:hypothetical protein